MTTQITWSITAMDCSTTEQNPDTVIICHWTCSGTDGTYNASVYSTCGVTYTAGTPFTPYADLTQNQVLGWIWASGVDKTATEAAVEQQIQNQIDPPVVSPPLPWATPATA
jgi:hypothetical protein